MPLVQSAARGWRRASKGPVRRWRQRGSLSRWRTTSGRSRLSARVRSPSAATGHPTKQRLGRFAIPCFSPLPRTPAPHPPPPNPAHTHTILRYLAPICDMFNYAPHPTPRAAAAGAFFLAHHELGAAAITVRVDRATAPGHQVPVPRRPELRRRPRPPPQKKHFFLAAIPPRLAPPRLFSARGGSTVHSGSLFAF